MKSNYNLYLTFEDVIRRNNALIVFQPYFWKSALQNVLMGSFGSDLEQNHFMSFCQKNLNEEVQESLCKTNTVTELPHSLKILRVETWGSHVLYSNATWKKSYMHTRKVICRSSCMHSDGKKLLQKKQVFGKISTCKLSNSSKIICHARRLNLVQ